MPINILLAICYNIYRKGKADNPQTAERLIKMKNKWEVLHDCDDDNGNPSVYFLKVGENKYYFLELLHDGMVDVIDCDCHTVLMTCRNLVSAKRWVSINLL